MTARARIFIVAILLGVLVAGPAYAGTAPRDPGGIARSVIQNDNVQDQLPSEKTTLGDGVRIPSAAAAPIAHFDSLFQILLWAGLVCAVVFLATFLLSQGPDGRRIIGRYVKRTGEHERAVVDGPVDIVSSADELASAGRYTEAMHQMLSDALMLLRRRPGGEVPDALTNRELLRAIRLEPRQKDALREMIRQVEQTWFADRSAMLADYLLVRTHFVTFSTTAPAA